MIDQELRKKNRRLMIAMVVFAVLLTATIILWKLSIYQIPPK
jgi:hypothetical protein